MIFKKIINKIKITIGKIYLYMKFLFQSLSPNKKIYILGTPIHGNIGDQAIIYAEKEFLRENFNEYKVIEVESKMVKKVINYINKNLKKDDIVTVHGGGFIGSLWLDEEKMFRLVNERVDSDKILVLPQTVYFSNDEYGKNVLADSQKSYGNSKKLIISCREKYSYDFMKKNFPEVSVLLMPDIVLYLDKIKNNFKRNNVIFCVRNDKEKIAHNYNIIEKIFIEDYYMNIDYTDTVINKNIYDFNRKKIILKKLEQIGKHKFMVTDRLHGMVFAYLTNTPCIVFENKSYKVKGIYEWLKKNESLKLVSDNTPLDEINAFIKKAMNHSMSDFIFDKKEFAPLIKVLRDNELGWRKNEK